MADAGLLDPQLQQLLQEHKAYLQPTADGKIHCLVNGMDLAARHDVVAAFVKGPKFAKLRKRYDADNALAKYEPFIVPSMNFPLMLYCSLTGQLMDKSVEAIKKHMKGKKFERNKELFAADKKELKPEPDIDTVLAEITGRKLGGKKQDSAELGAEAGEGHMEGVEWGGEGEGKEADEGEELDGEGGEEEEGAENEAMEEEAAPAAPPPARTKPAKATVQAAAGSTKKQPSSKPTQQQQEQPQEKAAGRKRGREKGLTLGAAKSERGGKAGRQQGQQGGGGTGSAAGGGAGGDEEPELWVPSEFAAAEGALGEGDDEDMEEEGSEPAAPAKKGGKAGQGKSKPGKGTQQPNGSAPHVDAAKPKGKGKKSGIKPVDPDAFVFAEEPAEDVPAQTAPSKPLKGANKNKKPRSGAA